MLTSSRRPRVAEEGGFTMVTVMVTMMILGLFVVGAWSAANADIGSGRGDQDRKRAYEAAQAGIEWYSYQIARDPNYWQDCANVPAMGSGRPAPVSLEGSSSPTWATVASADGSSQTQEQWRIEIMNTPDSSGRNYNVSCSTSDPSGTALDRGTLRVRATGRANGRYRSIIGEYRRVGFLNYIYYTSYETQDPIISGVSGCNVVRSRRSSNCVVIQFQNADRINGPMHTDDESVVACGSPTFGRTGKQDNFEVAGPTPGYISASGCGTASPTFNGPRILPAGSLGLPAGNSKLQTLAGANWTFTGQTCLVFRNDDTVDVYKNQSWSSTGRVTCNQQNGGTMTNMPLSGTGSPPNGVIYVTGSGTNCSYSKVENYDNAATCADVAVSGTYRNSLTIGSGNDIVVNGDLIKSGDAMMGLIATNFVRVYHPMSGHTNNSCGSVVTYPQVSEIDAAILALAHSFAVDNYDCGNPLGSLTVSGAIAQYYRGTVGTGSGTNIATGYAKNYVYDDRLKYRSPPYFLDPVVNRWAITRQTEQQPANRTP